LRKVHFVGLYSITVIFILPAIRISDLIYAAQVLTI